MSPHTARVRQWATGHWKGHRLYGPDTFILHENLDQTTNTVHLWGASLKCRNRQPRVLVGWTPKRKQVLEVHVRSESSPFRQSWSLQLADWVALGTTTQMAEAEGPGSGNWMGRPRRGCTGVAMIVHQVGDGTMPTPPTRDWRGNPSSSPLWLLHPESSKDCSDQTGVKEGHRDLSVRNGMQTHGGYTPTPRSCRLFHEGGCLWFFSSNRKPALPSCLSRTVGSPWGQPNAIEGDVGTWPQRSGREWQCWCALQRWAWGELTGHGESLGVGWGTQKSWVPGLRDSVQWGRQGERQERDFG